MSTLCPISVLIPTRNEERNLGRCLEVLSGWADEVVVVDSQSTDSTLEIASRYKTKILQFYYYGGWPKKRQWALDNYEWRNNWILLLDADEILLPNVKEEIESAIQIPRFEGYWIKFQIHFIGHMLQHGGTQLWKLSLFRKGAGRYEQRLSVQDPSMADMEVHEHVVVRGNVGRLNSPIRHENFNTLDRYILKHNEYSNWMARVLFEGQIGEVKPALFGDQAQRRRWLMYRFVSWPGSPLALFVLKFVLLRGFLDGVPGFIYCCLQAVQLFHVKAKLYELRRVDRI